MRRRKKNKTLQVSYKEEFKFLNHNSISNNNNYSSSSRYSNNDRYSYNNNNKREILDTVLVHL